MWSVGPVWSCIAPEGKSHQFGLENHGSKMSQRPTGTRAGWKQSIGKTVMVESSLSHRHVRATKSNKSFQWPTLFHSNHCVRWGQDELYRAVYFLIWTDLVTRTRAYWVWLEPTGTFPPVPARPHPSWVQCLDEFLTRLYRCPPHLHTHQISRVWVHFEPTWSTMSRLHGLPEERLRGWVVLLVSSSRCCIERICRLTQY